MAASISSPADLANNALVRLGFKLRVGSLLDGSDHANSILDVYAQTRDEKLREFDYDFAMRTVALTLLKSAPVGGYFPPTTWSAATYPPIGFAFEYTFPTDCIKIRAVKPTPTFIINADPRPNPFQIVNDNGYTPARRVVVCNVPDAIATYTGQITNPATWDVAFAEAFAAALSRRLGNILVGGGAAQAAAQDEQFQTAIADADGR